MKGKIDKHGVLWIERGGELIPCKCPFTNLEFCCHACPLFDEPVRCYIGTDSGGENLLYATLSICDKELFFTEFTDERAK